MNKRRSLLVVVSLLCVGTWIGWSVIHYFTYQQAPELRLYGVENTKCYRGILNCTLEGQSNYTIDRIAVYLDDARLDLKSLTKIGSKRFQRPFQIDTLSLAHGKHTLEIQAVDRSYHRNNKRLLNTFYVDNVPLKASFLEQEYAVEQGHTIHVKVQTNKKVHDATVLFMADEYTLFPESEHSAIYECFIPISCEDKPNEHLLISKISDDVGNKSKISIKVHITQATFKKARGFVVAHGKLDAEKEISLSNKVLEQEIKNVYADSCKEKLWNGEFIYPIEVKRITTPFGEIRTTPEKGRYHHAAVDLVNIPKSVVWASQRGKVAIKERYLFSGNTVVLDHGKGVLSLYFHLEDFASDIQVGDIVKKGQPLGRLGMTGYASGYHLHWEHRVNNCRVDPIQWTLKTF